MSSPGLVIGNSANPEELLYFGIRQKKKQVSLKDNVILLEPPAKSYKLDVERYSQLADMYISILKKYGITHIWMEGYAYGATGNTFNIGECTGILKYKLWEANIQFDILQPGEIKKFATGKGNANKTLMYDAYVAKTNHMLDHIIDDHKKGDKIPSPVDDLVDAYFLLQRGLSTSSESG